MESERLKLTVEQ
jgi:hypothetical protein